MPPVVERPCEEDQRQRDVKCEQQNTSDAKPSWQILDLLRLSTRAILVGHLVFATVFFFDAYQNGRVRNLLPANGDFQHIITDNGGAEGKIVRAVDWVDIILNADLWMGFGHMKLVEKRLIALQIVFDIEFEQLILFRFHTDTHLFAALYLRALDLYFICSFAWATKALIAFGATIHVVVEVVALIFNFSASQLEIPTGAYDSFVEVVAAHAPPFLGCSI
mmetsp:Transcript_10183/g.20215  ORF Transcript_10183/g.20215 Transcript_10183/m.20215 type:complete len:220 (+) Transcript_10183:1480-2139(+)